LGGSITVDCAIYRLPLRSFSKGKGKGGGKGERRKKKGKEKEKGKKERTKKGKRKGEGCFRVMQRMCVPTFSAKMVC